MKRFIEKRVDAQSCSFCSRRSRRKNIAAPFDEVVDHIKRSLEVCYSSPDDAGMVFESAEGGYQGTTFDSWELLNEEIELELPRDTDNKLLEELAFGLGDQSWSEKDLYGTGPDDRLAYGWDRFCEVVKHERRFFFLRTGRRPRLGDDMSLGAVLRTIVNFARQIGLLKLFPTGREFVRVRKQSGRAFTTARDLGPPPAQFAHQSNRMSPPGIAMTYVSEREETALRETADEPGDYAVATFTNNRDIRLLDLAALPPIPSMFEEVDDALEFNPRHLLLFLHHVERDMSRPIARDDRIHVEYVPTQVVTEYVRVSGSQGVGRVDGIRYRSSRHVGGVSLVLFASQENLVVEETDGAGAFGDRWLQLRTAALTALSAEQMAAWQEDRANRDD